MSFFLGSCFSFLLCSLLPNCVGKHLNGSEAFMVIGIWDSIRVGAVGEG
jgi:hypothetical protein